MCGPTLLVVTDLLPILEVCNTIRQLNEKVDGLLRYPPFKCSGLVIGGESLDFYFRNVVESL
jgi:hypothetical protein